MTSLLGILLLTIRKFCDANIDKLCLLTFLTVTHSQIFLSTILKIQYYYLALYRRIIYKASFSACSIVRHILRSRIAGYVQV